MSRTDPRALTRELLAFNTINPPGMERACARHLGAMLEDAGFNVGYHEFAEARTSLIAQIGGDEALTPDSSRFWPLATWREGSSPESFDKQYVRNWLDSIGFDRKPPAPPMPPEVARKTSEKYQEAARRLMR